MRPALILLATALLAGCGPNLAPSAAVSPGSSPSSAASAPRIGAPPVAPPTPPGNALPNFACADVSGGRTGVANAITARVAEQQGYDRFVLQFDSIIPLYTVKRQAKPVFSSGGSGKPVTMNGAAGVLVTVHSATAVNTFTGPTDLLHPEYQVLFEAKQVEDYEGYYAWGLALSKPACMRVFVLQEPARLVIDFQA
ncbi:MAG TPA: hypothetical protein VJT78_14815 [Candidatus Dormibacteraeota bacterium]|nr:hypothetical protein [Candidatus Dormibacteraeota bacterium]